MDTLEFEVDRRVGTVTLTRPDRLNSISEAVMTDLEDVIDMVEGDPEIRALVIGGSGSAFSVGLDLELLIRAFDDPGFFRAVLFRYHQILLRIEELDTPVVAAVNGLTRAGGFELMLACDLVLVAEEARIGDNHTNFGVMPGGGSTFRLPAKIGDQKARELIMTAPRWLGGREAVEYGLALRAVPAERLAEAVAELCSTLVDKPRAVHGAVKRAMRLSRGRSFAEAVDCELAEFESYMLGRPEGREGFAAYVEGRPPTWA